MVQLSISKILGKLGIKTALFYITRELLDDNVELNLEPKLKPITCGFLSPSDVKELYSKTEISNLAEEFDAWLESG